VANIWISLVLFPVLAVIAGSHLYTVYTYRRFSDHLTGCGLTGAQVARLLLDKVGLSQVKVREVQGLLVDGYDVTSSTIRLSSENFHSTWVAAAGIAAHEVGRVLQAYYTDQHPGFTLLNPRMAIFFNPAGKLGGGSGWHDAVCRLAFSMASDDLLRSYYLALGCWMLMADVTD